MTPTFNSPAAGSAEASLMEADREFCRDTQARGAAGWAAWFARDGIMYPPAGKIVGRESIQARMEPVLTGSSSLRWEPLNAVVDGDLGYTLGKWQLITRTPEGHETVEGTGNYVSIWRRTGEGWRVAVDIGNQDA